MTNGWSPVAPLPSRFISSPVGSRTLHPTANAFDLPPGDGALHADQQIAKAAGTASGGKDALLSDFTVRLPKEMRQRVGRAEPVNGRLRDDRAGSC